MISVHTTLPVPARTAQTACVFLASLLLLSACQGDGVAAAPIACTAQPGCQSFGAPVSAVVLDALDDARLRIAAALGARSRQTVDAPLRRLHDALTSRDMLRGRIALNASLEAIARIERDMPHASAECGAIRLALVPAARALQLDARDVLR